MILAGVEAPPIHSKVRHLVDDQEDEQRETELISKMMGDITEFEQSTALVVYEEKKQEEDVELLQIEQRMQE